MIIRSASEEPEIESAIWVNFSPEIGI